MADPDPSLSPPLSAPTLSSPVRASVQPVRATIEELDQSQSELMARIKSLKEDLQKWRSKMDNQINTYKNELSELKMMLNTDLDQVRSEFKALRGTLQKQQEDVTTSLRNLGLQDTSENPEDSENQKVDDNLEKAETPLSDGTKDI